jgi:hypothetical protein
MNTLHESILQAGEAVSSRYAVSYYLNPIGQVIEPYTVVGAGIPRAAYHNIWVEVFTAPADAIPQSVVENLLAIEDQLIYDCQHNWLGTEWNGFNHVGLWKEKPNYPWAYNFEIACFWDPADWFEPVLGDLKTKWQKGINATSIVDSEDLGNIYDGMVDREEAIQWLENMIEEWEEEDD